MERRKLTFVGCLHSTYFVQTLSLNTQNSSVSELASSPVCLLKPGLPVLSESHPLGGRSGILSQKCQIPRGCLQLKCKTKLLNAEFWTISQAEQWWMYCYPHFTGGLSEKESCPRSHSLWGNSNPNPRTGVRAVSIHPMYPPSKRLLVLGIFSLC